MNSLLASIDFQNPIAGIDATAQVAATEAALDLLGEIQARHGTVSFHHEGGYSNGADTMCLPQGELRLSDGDILLGEVMGAGIFVSGRNAGDWDARQFILDAIHGTGSSFSLDGGTGRRFFVRSQRFDAV